MKMKIKVKTLILLGFLFVLVIVWGIPNAMLIIAKSVEPEKATFFYEKYTAYPTTSNIKGGYFHGKSLVDFNKKYMIYSNLAGGGDTTNPEQIIKAKEILQATMANTPRNEMEKPYYMDAYEMLLDVAIATGDAPLLREWISFGQENGDEELTYIADIYNGFLLHVNGDRDQAQIIIDQYEDTDFHDVNLDVLKAEILLFEGNDEEAKRIYENLSERNWMQDNFGSMGYHYRNYKLDDVMRDFKGDYVIKGTVTHEGEPMPFVEINVQPTDGGVGIGSESYIGITDENGRFETLGLKDGLYNIGVGVDNSLLQDKILQDTGYEYFEVDGTDEELHFEFKDTIHLDSPEKLSEETFSVSWEAVEDADYYTVEIVSFGESGTVFWSSAIGEDGMYRFNDTSATIHTELQRAQIGGHGLGIDGLITPNAILGPFLPGEDYPLIINAYNEEDLLLTRSLPLATYYDEIPSITIEGNPTEGEGMILNQDYPEAIEHYENILKSDPENTEALLYLTKMYTIGWKNGEKNIERALELGNRFPNPVGKQQLFDNIIWEMEIDEIKENMDVYYSVIEDKKEEGEEYHYYLSKYYIATEDWTAARDALRNTTETYTPENVFYLDMYFQDYDKALDSAKHLHRWWSTTDQVTAAVENLMNNPPKDDDKEIFDAFLLELVTGVERDEGKDRYNETRRQISDPNLKAILHSIYKENGWDISETS